MKSYKIRLLIAISLLAIGCENQHIDEITREISEVTLWTEKMELFMEYPTPIAGEAGKYLIHLTILDDFQPVRSGKVTLSFKPINNETITVEYNELLREGIFTPFINIPSAGEYDFILSYQNGRLNETFELERIRVYGSKTDIPTSDDEHYTGISFLKEQQWKTKFSTSIGQYRKIRSSISVVGEVIPDQHGYAEIVAHVEGILSVEHNQEMVTPGSKVRKGDVLLTICPPVTGNNSWTELQLAYQKSKTEFERAERLLKNDAISKRDYEEAKRTYLIQKSGYDAFTTLINPSKVSTAVTEYSHLEIHSPIDGIITEVVAKPGQNINAGEKLMTVLDPSPIWIKMNIYEKDYYKIGESQGAEIKIPGLDKPVYLNKHNWRVLSKGEIIDPSNRTLPLLVEINNPERIFKVGQMLQVNLYTSAEMEVFCVPESAIFEEAAQKIVFIQIEGEVFEKRVIKTGVEYEGYVEILDGIKVDERVVTNGGYMVKLASNSKEIGDPHTH
ncbi:efflux RND transporter periplasmic adaptor subunit [Bacteroidota bacterium]